MNISDILELTKAGWTKEEIMRIAEIKDAEKIEHPEAKPETKEEVKPETKDEAKPETKEEAKPETKEEAKPETKDEAKPETKEEAKPETKETETDKLLKALGIKLDAMTNAIQNSNVNNIEQGTVNVLTAEDVIASIINPEGGKN